MSVAQPVHCTSGMHTEENTTDADQALWQRRAVERAVAASHFTGRSRTPVERTDQQLVDAFLAGDASAFSVIVERHRARLLHVAKRYVRGNSADAEDVVQDAFFKAARNLESFRAEATLSTWLYRLVLNSSYDFTHHRFRREVSTLDSDEINADYDIRLAVDTRGHSDDAMALGIALNQIHPDQRRALLAIDAVGFSIEEFAAQEGVKPGTIKSRRARARLALAKALEEQNMSLS